MTDTNNFFKVQRRFTLGGEDLFSLNNLYLPLIGVDSYSLYNYLFTLSSKEKYTFKKLLDALHLISPEHLSNSFDKLEALGLLKRYYSEQNGYLFDLIVPLDTKSFLSNPLLFSFLKKQIGEVEVKNIEKQIKKEVKDKEYKNITKSFDDVFKIQDLKENKIFASLFIKKVRNNITIKNSKFDYIYFKLLFDSNVVDNKIFEDENFERSIMNISYTYSLNEEEMKDVLLSSISIDNDLTINSISKFARQLYQNKNKGTFESFVTRTPDVYTLNDADDDVANFIREVESMTPKQMLSHLSNNNVAPSVSELKVFEELLNNTKFTTGVINIMIIMANEELNGQIPGYNYFEKIANELARNNIKTAKDAFYYFNNKKIERESKTVHQNKTYKQKTKKPTPKWQDEYENELKNKKEEDISSEEAKKILEKTKNIFK